MQTPVLEVKPLRRRDRDLVERVVSLMIEAHENATCSGCGLAMPACDMFASGIDDSYICDDCLRPKSN